MPMPRDMATIMAALVDHFFFRLFKAIGWWPRGYTPPR
jgi:hypothetical protein